MVRTWIRCDRTAGERYDQSTVASALADAAMSPARGAVRRQYPRSELTRRRPSLKQAQLGQTVCRVTPEQFSVGKKFRNSPHRGSIRTSVRLSVGIRHLTIAQREVTFSRHRSKNGRWIFLLYSRRSDDANPEVLSAETKLNCVRKAKEIFLGV